LTTDRGLDPSWVKQRGRQKAEKRPRKQILNHRGHKVNPERNPPHSASPPIRAGTVIGVFSWSSLVQDLHGASPDDLARVEVGGVGFNLRWAALDVDLYVPALVAGIFGTRTWMAQEQDRIAPQ